MSKRKERFKKGHVILGDEHFYLILDTVNDDYVYSPFCSVLELYNYGSHHPLDTKFWKRYFACDWSILEIKE